MSLLATAKGVPVKGRALPSVDSEELDLALAVLRGEVTQSQAAVALDKGNGSVTNWAWRIVSSAVASGNVVVERRKAVSK